MSPSATVYLMNVSSASDSEGCALPVQAGGLVDRLAEAANSTTDPLARQGAFETYTALITEIGHPVEPFVALVLATIFEKCSDKVMIPFFHLA